MRRKVGDFDQIAARHRHQHHHALDPLAVGQLGRCSQNQGWKSQDETRKDFEFDFNLPRWRTWWIFFTWMESHLVAPATRVSKEGTEQLLG